MNKRVISFILIVVIAFSMMPSAFAARDVHFEEWYAGLLHDLGLFKGVGTNVDGTINYDLNRNISRAEALVMLIRLKGEETAAREAGFPHPFADVPGWASPFVGWGYERGYTKGVSDDMFGTDDPASPEMYITFVLRALGYSDTSAEPDFKWSDPYALAGKLGLLGIRELDLENFLRADVALVSWKALKAVPKVSAVNGMIMAEVLISAGTFTREQWENALLNEEFCPYTADMHDGVAVGTFTCYKDGAFEYDERWRPNLTLYDDNTFKIYSNMGEGMYRGTGRRSILPCTCSGESGSRQ